MKVFVSLYSATLCLAFIRDIAGYVHRHEYHPEMDQLSAQPLNYDQRNQMEVPRMYEKRHHKNDENHQHQIENFESKDKSYEDINKNYATLQGVRNWNSPLSTTIVSQDDNPTYDDMVNWNDFHIATGPNSPIVDQKYIDTIFNEAYKTMKRFTVEEKNNFHSAYLKNEKKKNEVMFLNSTQLLKKHEYNVEEHTVHTDDGYHLTVFRIEPKNSENEHSASKEIKGHPVVFLAHGLLGSSDDWLLMGPQKSLAFMLAYNGYEVWIGNSRGSRYARHHASKHEALPDFWQYSNDEIALHDTPAMIDYVLKTSEQEKLHYVGISQGTTAIFALASTHPEYNEKIKSVHAISPMVYMTKVRSPILRMIAPNSPFSERLEQKLGTGEFKPTTELIQNVGGDLCENEVGCKKVCSNIYFVMAGVGDLSTELAPVMMGHLPAGASTKQMRHYGQGVASHEFRKFDYGPEINSKVYGHVQPPKYKISNVEVPVFLYSTQNDWLSHPDDVTRLHRELPNVKGHYKFTKEHFTHMDFLFSEKAPQVLYEGLINNMKQNQEWN